MHVEKKENVFRLHKKKRIRGDKEEEEREREVSIKCFTMEKKMGKV